MSVDDWLGDDTGAVTGAVPFLSWEQFNGQLVWNQGEHIALIGPTGSGKTTLALALLPRRAYVTVLATKPKDETLDHFGKANNYKVLRHWQDRGFWRGKGRVSVTKYPRRIVWPDARSVDMDTVVDRQRKAFREAIQDMFQSGGWCIYMDELWWFAQMLKMDKIVKMLLQQSRSIKVSLVVATQRPAWVPVEIYDQSTHLFFWRDNDERNLNRISGISWLSADHIRNTVAALDTHEVLYVNTRTGEMVRTMSPPPGKV